MSGHTPKCASLISQTNDMVNPDLPSQEINNGGLISMEVGCRENTREKAVLWGEDSLVYWRDKLGTRVDDEESRIRHRKLCLSSKSPDHEVWSSTSSEIVFRQASEQWDQMGKNLLCYNDPVSRYYVSVLTILLRVSVSAPVATTTEQLLHLRLRILQKRKPKNWRTKGPGYLFSSLQEMMVTFHTL